MTIDTPLALLALLGSFTAMLLGVFLIIVPSRNRLANLMLGVFLILTAVDISAWFASGWWRANPELVQILPALSALQMPAFTGFIWFSCFDRKRLRAPDLLHLLPAFLILGFSLSGRDLAWLPTFLELQYVLYIGAAILILIRLRRVVTQRFSQASQSFQLLSLLVAASLVAHGLFVVRRLAAPFWSASDLLAMQLASAFLVLGITLWMAFMALLKPQLFRGTDKVASSAAKILAGNEGSEDLGRLDRFMRERRPFLDPALTLERLARQTGIPAKRLSAAINQQRGSHFFDFLNGYRIDHAKHLMATTDETITGILYASGFNSKSSFNTAFRKQEGMTPSAYRKALN